MNPESSPKLRNGFSRMILDRQIAQARAMSHDRKKRLASVRTRKEAEAYRDEVAAKIAKCFGKFPARTPLRARTTGTIEGPYFRTEKVVFESRPDFFVTANLYVPNALKEPAPAVLGNCGHDRSGKASNENQTYSQELAQCGFVVLTFDPIAQGERDQHLSLPTGHVLRTNCAQAHVILGQQLQLAGEFFGSWMAWDGMRALDYLLSRAEVDPARIGVTGNSGGGCLSTWLWALDRRISMAAPSCWVNSFLAVIENEVGGDAEQMPPGILEAGLDHGDFFLARLPEPAMIIAQRHDFFDRRAVAETAREVSRIYALFGQKDRFGVYIGDHTHGYFDDGRRAMRAFFCRHQQQRAPKKLHLALQPVDALFASKGGEVLANGSLSVGQILVQKAPALCLKRGRPAPALLRSRLIETLGLRDYRKNPLPYRNLRSDWLAEGRLFGRYAVRTEPGIEVILRKVFLPAEGLVQALSVEREVVLYVPHWSSHADFLSFDPAKKLLERLPVFAVEVRGVGESMCRDKDDPEVHYWMDYLAQGFDQMFGISHLGRRAFDLLKTCDLLVQEGANKIRVVARGQGSLIASIAAALHPQIEIAELHDAPVSFVEWLGIDDLAWPASMCPRGVLQRFDLPDIYRVFHNKLRVKSHWNAATCLPPRPRG